MTKAELYQKACMLPLLPGVYIIRDKSDTIIYIGKAKRLRILQQDIVLGGVRLDLAGFQHQRLELALADDDIKRIGVGDHLAERVRGAGAGSQPDQGAHPQVQYPAEG